MDFIVDKVNMRGSVVGSLSLGDLFKNRINRNVLVVGSSGSGKSILGDLLNRFLLPKTVLLYKDDKTYGDPVSLKSFLPSPYIDPDLFVNSWEAVLAPDRSGIMSESVLPLLAKYMPLVKGDKGILRSVFSLIRLLEKNKSVVSDFENPMMSYLSFKLKMLYSGSEFNKLKEGVISFSGLTDPVALFFSDYYLRLIYKSLNGGGVFIDELHRLGSLRNGIVGQIVREVRSSGYVVGISQSLSDLGDDLITNFGSIFCFDSVHVRDLSYLRGLDLDLPGVIMGMPLHCFLDVRAYLREHDKGVMPLYRVRWKNDV